MVVFVGLVAFLAFCVPANLLAQPGARLTSVVPATSQVQQSVVDTAWPRDLWDLNPLPVTPLFWWNDLSDFTIGARWRHSGSGMSDRLTIGVHRGFGGVAQSTFTDAVDFFVKYENPSWLRAEGGIGRMFFGPQMSQSAEVWAQEGVIGAGVNFARREEAGSSGWMRSFGFGPRWVATRNVRFLPLTGWENAGTIELAGFTQWRKASVDQQTHLRVDASFGTGYRQAVAPPPGPLEWHPIGQLSVTALKTKRFGRFVVGVRSFVGANTSGSSFVLQRGFPVHGASVYETRRNPLIHSVGAPFVRGDFFYHTPGNGNLRGFRTGMTSRWLGAVNVEIEADVIVTDHWLRRVALVAFWDGGVADTLAFPIDNRKSTPLQGLSDFGPGARFWVNFGGVTIPIRVEFPLYVNTPRLALGSNQFTDQFDFRWLISFEPVF